MDAAVSAPTIPKEHLLATLDAWPFKPYRQYRTYSRRQQLDILSIEADQACATPDAYSIATGEGTSGVVALGRRLAWDSAYFGVPMGRLDVVAAASATNAERADAVARAVAAARETGLRHLTARVDVADLETLAVLEAHGFRTMDALGTYIMRPGKDTPADVRRVGPVRVATADDAGAILDITREAYAGYRGRFHLDPHLPADRADGFYEVWARQCLAGAMADVVMVSEDSNCRVIGYLAFRRREPASSVGTPIYGGGLGACRRDTPGAYASLIRDSAMWAHDQGAVAECQTQISNFPVIRVYETVGFHYVRAEFTLHAWVTP
jgi:L-amino acid N-acyltransferase YncA